MKLILEIIPTNEDLQMIFDRLEDSASDPSQKGLRFKRELSAIFKNLAEQNWINGYASALRDMKKEKNEFREVY